MGREESLEEHHVKNKEEEVLDQATEESLSEKKEVLTVESFYTASVKNIEDAKQIPFASGGICIRSTILKMYLQALR